MPAIIYAPRQLLAPPYSLRSLTVDGASLMESCTHQAQSQNSMYTTEHLLVLVQEGEYRLHWADETVVVPKGEAVLIRKTHYVDYEKIRLDEQVGFKSLFFFIKDSFLKEFLLMNPSVHHSSSITDFVVKLPLNATIRGFVESVLPYFDELHPYDPGLLRLKMLELLYNLSGLNADLIGQLVSFSQLKRHDIPTVMDANFTRHLSLNEFAYLCGRSLSAFKREFHQIYGLPPGQWLLRKRLQRAHDLLTQATTSVSDAGYEAGFENIAHFSRAYKKYYGHSPSASRSA